MRAFKINFRFPGAMERQFPIESPDARCRRKPHRIYAQKFLFMSTLSIEAVK